MICLLVAIIGAIGVVSIGPTHVLFGIPVDAKVVGSGFLSLGAEGFYFKQVSCDSGAGATLGCFKGKTAGLGPVLGYIQPFSKTESLVLELKWLAEMDTQKRLEGDYIWLKAVYKF